MLLKFRYSFQFFDGFYFVYSLKFDTKNQTMFELKLQFSRFRASPVCRLSHIRKQRVTRDMIVNATWFSLNFFIKTSKIDKAKSHNY